MVQWTDAWLVAKRQREQLTVTLRGARSHKMHPDTRLALSVACPRTTQYESHALRPPLVPSNTSRKLPVLVVIIVAVVVDAPKVGLQMLRKASHHSELLRLVLHHSCPLLVRHFTRLALHR